MPQKVLIITYYYPPAGGAGVQRWLKFSNLMVDLGWSPIILTVKNGSFQAYDDSMLDEIHPSIKVFRTSSIEPFRIYNFLRGKKGKSVEAGMTSIKEKASLFQRIANHIRANWFIPDARRGWNYFAISKAKTILKQHDIKAIITTGPPHSSHLIGLSIAKQHKLPWLADFRDPWTQIYYNQYLNRTKRSIQLDYRLESQILQNADAVTVVGQGMYDEFKERTKNIHIIYNGYDPQDFEAPATIDSDKFKLSYIGGFMANQNHLPLWEAISELIQTDASFKAHFQLRLTGKVDDPKSRAF
ncbi:MAG: glycosyltransferase [Bacteroidota bacterium]